MTDQRSADADFDTGDKLAGPRDAVARAIVELQTFTGTAGSAEMRLVTSAIETLGYAYSMLRAQNGNPAWPC